MIRGKIIVDWKEFVEDFHRYWLSHGECLYHLTFQEDLYEAWYISRKKYVAPREQTGNLLKIDDAVKLRHNVWIWVHTDLSPNTICWKNQQKSLAIQKTRRNSGFSPNFYRKQSYDLSKITLTIQLKRIISDTPSHNPSISSLKVSEGVFSSLSSLCCLRLYAWLFICVPKQYNWTPSKEKEKTTWNSLGTYATTHNTKKPFVQSNEIFSFDNFITSHW